MAGVLVQKVAVGKHSVVEHWLVEMETAADWQHFADGILVDFV